jgi:hypothetical protein
MSKNIIFVQIKQDEMGVRKMRIAYKIYSKNKGVALLGEMITQARTLNKYNVKVRTEFAASA